MTTHHAVSSPPTLAAIAAALAPALVLALAACNGASKAPADAGSPPASSTPSTAVQPAPAPATAPPDPATAPTPPPMGTQLARYDGYGDMQLGMEAGAARKAWQGELKGPPDGGETCFYLHPVSTPTPADFGFMFEGGKFVRYDVGNDRELAPGGGKVGMGEAEIDALYRGRVEASAHKYDPAGKVLRIKDAASPGVLVFELGGGKVTAWRVGLPPQVDYVEGCS